jgi:hypothetical protein
LVTYNQDFIFDANLESGLNYAAAPDNFWSDLGLDHNNFISSAKDQAQPFWNSVKHL